MVVAPSKQSRADSRGGVGKVLQDEVLLCGKEGLREQCGHVKGRGASQEALSLATFGTIEHQNK